MDKARKFKEMLQGANPDIGLLQTYVKEVRRASWLDKLGPKTVRFGVASIAGVALEAALPTGVSAVAGFALGGFDFFLLDKIARGWRPNSFIENSLEPFLKPKD
jgi:hypothetical protein